MVLHSKDGFVLEDCPCGHNEHPRIDIITGRTDDMVKVKGVNMFPAQFEEILAFTDGASSEYQIMIDHLNGRDILTFFFETAATGEEKEKVEHQLAALFKAKLNMTPVAKGVAIGELPRSEKKTRRIYDNRY